MVRLCFLIGIGMLVSSCGNLKSAARGKGKARSEPASLNAEPSQKVNAIPGEKVARTDPIANAGLRQNCCGREEYLFNASNDFCEYMGEIECDTPTPNRCAYKAPQACSDKAKAAAQALGAGLTPQCQAAVTKRHELMTVFFDSKPCATDADCSLYTETYAACPQVHAISKLTFRSLASRQELSLSAEVMKACATTPDRTCPSSPGSRPVCVNRVCGIGR